MDYEYYHVDEYDATIPHPEEHSRSLGEYIARISEKHYTRDKLEVMLATAMYLLHKRNEQALNLEA